MSIMDYKDELAALAASTIKSECDLANSLMGTIGSVGTQEFIPRVLDSWTKSMDCFTCEVYDQGDDGVHRTINMYNHTSGLFYSIQVRVNQEGLYTSIKAQYWHK